MAYYSSTQTDKYLQELEKKIATIYGEANAELTQEAATYFAKFKTRYQNEYEAYQQGAYTKAEFDAWVKSQVLRGQHWVTLRDNAAERITNANKVAAAYINDATPSIYTLNYNYEGYRAENEVVGISFDICDEQTVKRLIKDNPSVLPTLPQIKAVNIPRDQLWNQQKLAQSVASAIIQGKSISKLADSFQHVTNMNRTSAIRNARTAFTSAQNGGRQESYNSLADMGVNVQKRWVATLDSATRESHKRVDGEVVDYKDTFSNGLEYPADPAGSPAEVYNCRCTMEAVFDENKNGTRTRRARNEEGENETVMNMTYKGKSGTASYESWIKNKTSATGTQLYGSWLDTTRKGIINSRNNKILRVAKGTPMSYKEADSGNTNPYYGTRAEYDWNCQTCAVVFEARLRGYDLIAEGYDAVNSTMVLLSEHVNQAFIDPITGKNPTYKTPRTAMNESDFERFLEKNVKKGERYIMEVGWSGRRYGHAVNLDRNDKGQLRITDNQSGDEIVGRMLTKYLDDVDYTDKSRKPAIFRTDNMDLDYSIIRKVVRQA